jgi:hypothetical protein
LAEIGPVALDGFEVWDKRVQAPAGSGKRVAFVSVRTGGTVGLNVAPARCWVGDAVRVLYDPKRHRLGIVPGDPEAQDTYIIHYWDQIQIACRELFEFYGVDTSETRRCYDLELVDGVLIANPDRTGA